MLRIGLTGGIGSGKSVISKIFRALNIPVYDADQAAKKLMSEDVVLKEKIKNAFGEESYTGEELNKSYLAAEVFNDSAKLSMLNSLVHPATIKDAEDWMSAQESPYILKEAALIFESGSQKNLDLVIGVQAPIAMRIHRSMLRDSITAAQVKIRMDKQLDDVLKMSLCDYVIINDEKHLIIPQVLALHEKFKNGEK
ncbi:MAG: dephospho-CoA kinase [Ginsengibacter sp.]